MTTIARHIALWTCCLTMAEFPQALEAAGAAADPWDSVKTSAEAKRLYQQQIAKAEAKWKSERKKKNHDPERPFDHQTS